MRVIRAQIAASKRPQTSAVRVTWRRQRRKKLLFRAWHLISEEMTGGEEEERRGEERRKKEGREEEDEIGKERKEEVERPELVGCQLAQCDREGPSALPDTQDGRCRSRLIFIQLS